MATPSPRPMPLDPKTRARFLAKTRRNGDCWEWTAARRRGYGIFNVGTKRANNNRVISAHRYAYELFVGPVPEGLQLDHLCGNPPCVNAAHLEPVTAQENTLRSRSVAAERARRTKGHSDYMIRKGRRECRICRMEDGRQGRAERYRRALLRPAPPDDPSIGAAAHVGAHPTTVTRTSALGFRAPRGDDAAAPFTSRGGGGDTGASGVGGAPPPRPQPPKGGSS